MGEWSKKIGETGENIVAEFLRLIGWEAAQSGVEVPCVRGEIHSTPGHTRKTHGLDYLFAYRSPLVDGLGLNVIVSVKFSAAPYPQSAGSAFKSHFSDLAQAMNCFKNSEARRTISQTIKGVAKTQDIGVLFWINNDRNSDGDVIKNLGRVNLQETTNTIVYVVDNRRAGFIFDSIKYARQLAKGWDIEYFYQDTGRNVNPQCAVKHGPILPVEFINSNILAFRIADAVSDKRTLLISVSEAFSHTGLQRLLGLAQQLSQDWCSRVIVAFPDFDPLHHNNIVQLTKGSFANAAFVRVVEVHCVNEDFRTAQL